MKHILITDRIMAKKSQWLPSNYGQGGKNPFIDGEYYHLGFQNIYPPANFVYQGIIEYSATDGGFRDYAGYPLKPFPSHYIHIPKPELL